MPESETKRRTSSPIISFIETTRKVLKTKESNDGSASNTRQETEITMPEKTVGEGEGLVSLGFLFVDEEMIEITREHNPLRLFRARIRPLVNIYCPRRLPLTSIIVWF